MIYCPVILRYTCISFTIWEERKCLHTYFSSNKMMQIFFRFLAIIFPWLEKFLPPAMEARSAFSFQCRHFTMMAGYYMRIMFVLLWFSGVLSVIFNGVFIQLHLPLHSRGVDSWEYQSPWTWRMATIRSCFIYIILCFYKCRSDSGVDSVISGCLVE